MDGSDWSYTDEHFLPLPGFRPAAATDDNNTIYYSPKNEGSSVHNPADLFGAIFLCSNATFDECIKKNLFGAPRCHLDLVQAIEIGMPLFLFNYDKKRMFGMFEAASKGELNIDPGAWCKWAGGPHTNFPAQVVGFVTCFMMREPQKHFSSQMFILSRKRTEVRVELVSNTILSLTYSEIREAIMYNHDLEEREKLDHDPRQLLRPSRNWIRTLMPATCSSADFSSLRHTWRTGAMGGPADRYHESRRHMRLSLPDPVERLQGPQRHRVSLQQQGRTGLDCNGEDAAARCSTIQLGTSRPLEPVASLSERCLREQEVLREKRENLRSSLASMASAHTETMIHHLEVFAKLIEEMRQIHIRLRRAIGEAMSRVKQVERLNSAVTALDNSRISMTAELEILRRDVDVLCQQMEVAVGPTSVLRESSSWSV